MSNYILADGEYRLLSLIWDHAPFPSGQLVRLCEEEFGWKKSTTYTQVRRLADKGLLQNRTSGGDAAGNAGSGSAGGERPLRLPHLRRLPARLCGRISEGAYPERIGGKELKTLIDQHRG